MHQPENSTSRSKLSPAIHTTAMAAALILLSLLIFRDFIFGEKVLLYKDAGSDSINDYYPWFAHLSDYLRNTGLPSWSFFVGMGQPIYYAIGYLILDPVVWLPKAWIAHALVYQHLCKILVAELILLRFFQLRGLCFCAAAVGSLLVSLSAYMSIGSCWPVFADEVVCFSFLLLAIEETITRDRWVYLPFAILA